MADISPEIYAFKNAVYGEEVRNAMISLANKLNAVVGPVSDSETLTSNLNDVKSGVIDSGRKDSTVSSGLWGKLKRYGDNNWYICSFRHMPGEVYNIRLPTNNASNVDYSIRFYTTDNGNDYYLAQQINGSGSGTITVNVGIRFTSFFYIGIKCPGLGYVSKNDVDDPQCNYYMTQTSAYRFSQLSSGYLCYAYELNVRSPTWDSSYFGGLSMVEMPQLSERIINCNPNITTSASDGSLWISNKVYPAGYVGSINVKSKVQNDADCYIYIFMKDRLLSNYIYVAKYKFKNNSENITVPVYEFFEHEFVIGIAGKGIMYASNLNINPYRVYGMGDSTINSFNINTPSTWTSDFQHVYTIRMFPINFNMSQLFSNKSFSVAHEYIHWDSTQNVINSIPCNKVIKCDNAGGLQNGLPKEVEGLYHTIVKLSPYHTNSARTGWVIYLLYAAGYDCAPRAWYAFGLEDQTYEDLVWHSVGENKQTKHISKLGIENNIIGFIGDSIVEGYGESTYNGGSSGTSGHLIPNNVKTWYRNTGTHSWANMAIEYITNKYPNTTCFNNAIGGFTTYQIRTNLDTLAKDDNGNLATILICSIGTNDRNSENLVSQITTNLVMINNWCKRHGVRLILLTNTPVIGETKNSNNSGKVHSAIMDAADEYDIPVIDLYAEFNNYLWEHNIPFEHNTNQTKVYHDYLHPGDIGYNIMYHLFIKLLGL